MSNLTTNIGHWLYHKGNALEASLYGLKKQVINLGGIEHSVWRNPAVDKPTLLLIHGFSATHAVWLRFARFFTKDYHVVIPDLAGHGETGFKPEWDYSIPAQAQRVQQLLDALKVKQAHIAGNSMGGFIAAHMSRHYRDRCQSIILIDPAGVASPQPSRMQTMLMQGTNPFLIHSYDEFMRFFAMTMAKPPFLPKAVLKALSVDYQNRRAALAKIFIDYHVSDDFIDQDPSPIICPSLLLWGEQDQLLDVSSVKVWQSLLAGGETHVWSTLGHMPMLEAPKACAHRVKGFLQHH